MSLLTQRLSLKRRLVFQINQQLRKVLDLLKVSNPTLVAPPRRILDDASLDKWDSIRMHVLYWLNLQLLVVVAANLCV
ncbi:hypothetical protein D3C85_1067940 [compost metagenome]